MACSVRLTSFHARFSVRRDDAYPMRLYDPQEGKGHLVCATGQADSALALVIEAAAVGAMSNGEPAHEKLHRIIAGWAPLLEVVLGLRAAAIRWVYCSKPGLFQPVQYGEDTGRALLTQISGGFTQLQQQAPALATALLWAIRDAAPVQRHRVHPAFAE